MRRILCRKIKMRLRAQAGVTLVELLVAMAVGMVLLGGIYQVFVSGTAGYSLTEEMSRMQENGRFALYILKREVREAGFLGCLQDVTAVTNTLNNPDYFAFDFSNAIYGLEAVKVDGADKWEDHEEEVDPTKVIDNEAGDAYDEVKGMGLTDPVAGSDILVLRGVRGETPTIVNGMPPTSAELKIPTGLDKALHVSGIFEKDGGEILLVSDCESATVFQSTGYADSSGKLQHNAPSNPTNLPGNSKDDFEHSYGPGAEIFFYQTVTYYIRNNAAGQPSLYRKVNQDDVEELVEGVENMQVTYGEDTDGDNRADVYVDADEVTDWSAVVSVRIGLLMRSLNEVYHGPVDTATYDVDGDAEVNDADDFTAPGGNDRRLRMVMSGTIGLRNRLR